MEDALTPLGPVAVRYIHGHFMDCVKICRRVLSTGHGTGQQAI